VGALAVYLCGVGERSQNSQDSVMDKAKMIQQYMSQEQMDEMRKSNKK
jgi:hypothetical protein